jgi:hypothetical protein
MTDRYDVVSSRKDKDGKWRSTKIGAAFVKGDRINVVLDALPIGNGEGQAWLTLFPPKPREDDAPQRSTGKRQPSSNDDMNDDIPF